MENNNVWINTGNVYVLVWMVSILEWTASELPMLDKHSNITHDVKLILPIRNTILKPQSMHLMFNVGNLYPGQIIDEVLRAKYVIKCVGKRWYLF